LLQVTDVRNYKVILDDITFLPSYS
jgi:hypothetical protein